MVNNMLTRALARVLILNLTCGCMVVSNKSNVKASKDHDSNKCPTLKKCQITLQFCRSLPYDNSDSFMIITVRW